jgi:hypothetical protein
MANIIYFLAKQAGLLRRSTVLSLPLQLVFPDSTIVDCVRRRVFDEGREREEGERVNQHFLT